VPRSVSSVAAVSPRPRIIALPHFHGDDRFYHWRRYYDSFAEADSTLLFSASIAHQLKEVTENLNVVPGGGVRSDEHGDSAAESSFRQLHGRSVPFFLLLGRKTPSKGYEDVLRAHAALRTSGVDVDLVLIGPDEDGRRIEDPGVFYLGRQAREVIRGALRCCLALVTMSRSESFGIVICEAWLFGKAVIANRACYAFRELIRDGETGLLVSTETELIAAMRQLTESAETRDRLGRNGVNEVASKYTWEEVAQACFDVLVPQHV
jgi:glycosyltransferase involved in cell wall biosynthesis